MPQFTVGKLAKAAGIGTETVRYYEKSGLLPEPERLESGYRVYDDNAVSRLRFIQQAKNLGFALGEIKDMLALVDGTGADCEAICSRARQKRDEIEGKIAELQKISGLLTALEADCPGGTAPLDQCVILQNFYGEQNA
jgi:DNA-binding transcriptional MerR regulator|tara:strand:+ start:500 stop:913 length:414 start_codon:yes stop_codon:yes gene_type:complete